MSQLDALLARSRTPGTFIERSRFTLARSKAIEKMREFSLRHPRQYVLELVQAAVFARARWIAIDVTDHSIVVAWVGGKTLSRDELEGLFDYLFADQGVLETRHLMQTAVGVNAMLQRRPQRLRIESGDGKVGGTARMDLDKNGDGDVGVPQDPLAGTYIYADFGQSWFSRFLGTSAVPPEAGLVETRCMYTPVPILLNGSAPFGYRSSRSVQLFGVQASKDLTVGDRRGAIGIPEARVRPGMRLVVGGVWITERPIEQLGPDLVGVIGDDSLRKTADMSDIVEDARFIDMLHEVQPFATALIRARLDKYQPPRLPKRIGRTAPSTVEEELPAEPITQPMSQLGVRGKLNLTSLQAMAPTEPLFWVDVDSASDLAPACDPSVFPWRILVLSAGQAQTLSAMLGPDSPSPSRLTNTEDVSFVRNAMDRRVRSHDVSTPVTLHIEQLGAVRATLTLSLHLDGPPPRVDAGKTPHHLPLIVMHGGETITTAGIDLPLPGVRALLNIEEQAPLQMTHQALSAIRETVLHETWRLLPSSDHDDPKLEALVLSLLARWARPAFVRDSDTVRLATRFPTAWRHVMGQLLQTPLADTTSGPLTLQGLVDLQGTDQTVTLTDASDRHRLEPLEHRFGYGHVLVPDELLSPLALVGRTAESWRPLDRRTMGDPTLQEVIVIASCLRTVPSPTGWSQRPDLAPGISHWLRDGQRSIALQDGMSAAMRRLHDLSTTDFASRLHPELVSERRARSVANLATLRLGTLCDRLGEVRLRTVNHSSSAASLLLSDPALCVACHGGAAHTDDHVLPATLDELKAMEDARSVRLNLPSAVPLVLDDDPALWAAAPGSEDGWLVQHRVDLPKISGWLGLRHPWDPTPGVLIEAADYLQTMPALSARVPCHGMLTRRGARDLEPGEQELLLFGGLQLYQDLLQVLDDDTDPSRQSSASLYATAFSCIQRRVAGGLRGLALQLANKVDVHHEGSRWGSLADWLQSPPEQRPPAPPGVPAVIESARRAPSALQMQEGTWSTLIGPLQSALQLQRSTLNLTIREVSGEQRRTLTVSIQHSTSTRCTIDLQRTPIAQAALSGDDHLRGLLLLEGARLTVSWAKAFNVPIDPLELQRAVIAYQLAHNLSA